MDTQEKEKEKERRKKEGEEEEEATVSKTEQRAVCMIFRRLDDQAQWSVGVLVVVSDAGESGSVTSDSAKETHSVAAVLNQK